MWYKNFHWQEITGTAEDPLPRSLGSIGGLVVVYRGILNQGVWGEEWQPFGRPPVVYLYVWTGRPKHHPEWLESWNYVFSVPPDSEGPWLDNFMESWPNVGPLFKSRGENSYLVHTSPQAERRKENPTLVTAVEWIKHSKRRHSINYPEGWDRADGWQGRDFSAEYSKYAYTWVPGRGRITRKSAFFGSLNYPKGFYSPPPAPAYGWDAWDDEFLKKGEEKYAESFWGDSGSGILVVARDTERILLGLRSQDVHESNTWGNFGGAIGISDDGESEKALPPDQNALKEMVEEIGYTGPIEIIPSYTYRSPSFTYHNYIGVVDRQTDIPLNNFNWEVSELQWFTVEEVLALPNLHFGVSELMKQEEMMAFSAEQITELPTNTEGLITLLEKLLPALKDSHLGADQVYSSPRILAGGSFPHQNLIAVVEQIEEVQERARAVLPVHQESPVNGPWFFEPGLFLEFGPVMNATHPRQLSELLSSYASNPSENIKSQINQHLATFGFDLILIPQRMDDWEFSFEDNNHFTGIRVSMLFGDGRISRYGLSITSESIADNFAWGTRYYKLTLENINALLSSQTGSINYPRGFLAEGGI